MRKLHSTAQSAAGRPLANVFVRAKKKLVIACSVLTSLTNGSKHVSKHPNWSKSSNPSLVRSSVGHLSHVGGFSSVNAMKGWNLNIIIQSSLSHICEGCFKSLCRRTHRLRCVPFSTRCHQKQKCLKEGCCQGTTSELVTGLKKKKKTAWELKLFAPDDKQQPTFLKGKKGHKHNALKRTWKVA